MDKKEVTVLEYMQRQDERLKNIENLLTGSKAVLTLEEVSNYTGFSRSYLYKLTSTGKIPCYKPQGKMIFIDRIELEKWLLRNQIDEEIETQAATYVTLNKRGGKS